MMVKEKKHKEHGYIFCGYSSTYFMKMIYILYCQQDNIEYIILYILANL